MADWESARRLPAPFNMLAIPAYSMTFASDLLRLRKLRDFLINSAKKCWHAVIKCLRTKKGWEKLGHLPEDDEKDPPSSHEDMTKTMRMLKNKDWFGTVQHLVYLKALITKKLEKEMGEFEDTGTLIDKAVSALKKQTKKDLAEMQETVIEELTETINKKLDDKTKDIDTKMDKILAELEKLAKGPPPIMEVTAD